MLILVVFATFSAMDVAFSFWVNAESVTSQTVYALCKIALFMYLLHGLETNDLQMRILRGLMIAYWMGQGMLYIINFFRFDDFQDWLHNFNDIILLVPVYVASITLTIYTERWLKKRKRKETRGIWSDF